MFASLLHALGESPPVAMDEMGHTDPALALRVYAQSMRRDEKEATKSRLPRPRTAEPPDTEKQHRR